jgi:UDP-3-O-[3-hydroxymyristoyl] glucosamine N-acyltransferase
MRIAHPISAAALAAELSAELIGDGSILITGINEIHHVGHGDLSFVDHPKYYGPALDSEASVILIDQQRECPPGKALLIVEQPFTAYNNLVLRERPVRRWDDTIDPTARIGANTSIGPGAVVGAHAVIGRDCRIGPNAMIGEGVVLKDRVIVGPGAVIGSEAFYFKSDKDGRTSWRSGGSVLLEDDVDIGPNCNIARGTSSITTIGQGTKIDALVQIGHDCKIGRHCLMAAQVGIAGNVTVGDWCVFQGQAGIAQNVVLGDRTVVLAQSGVGKDLEGGKSYFGSPVQEARKAFKDIAVLRKLGKK